MTLLGFRHHSSGKRLQYEIQQMVLWVTEFLARNKLYSQSNLKWERTRVRSNGCIKLRELRWLRLTPTTISHGLPFPQLSRACLTQTPLRWYLMEIMLSLRIPMNGKRVRRAPNIVSANINSVADDRFDSLLFQTLSRALAAVILYNIGKNREKSFSFGKHTNFYKWTKHRYSHYHQQVVHLKFFVIVSIW